MLNVIPPTWRAECMHFYVIPASRGAQMYASRGSFIVGVFRESGEQQICTWERHVKIFQNTWYQSVFSVCVTCSWTVFYIVCVQNCALDISTVCPRSLFDLRIFADFKNVCRCMAHKCTILRSSSNTEVVVSGHIELQRIGCSLRP